MTLFKWILLALMVAVLAFLVTCELRKAENPPLDGGFSSVDTLYISSADTLVVERPDVMARLRALEAHQHGCKYWSIQTGPYGCPE